jgi:hypothetical protein
MTRSFLDLSTAHVSPTTRVWLDQQGVIAAARRVAADPDCMILMGSTPHGWFVYADGEACSDPAAFRRLLDRRITLGLASGGQELGHAAALREALHEVDRDLAALVTEPSPDIPIDLWACFARANAERCDYLLFDADAPEMPALPVFEEAEPVETSVVVIFPSGVPI